MASFPATRFLTIAISIIWGVSVTAVATAVTETPQIIDSQSSTHYGSPAVTEQP